MSWWAWLILAWVVGAALAALLTHWGGRWYRSSDRDRELQKMIKKTRRKMK